MDFKIIWSDFAEIQLDKIYSYFLENADLKVAKDILREITSEPDKLTSQPEIGQREELLLDRENNYRYLVCGNYKIIYAIIHEDKQIRIADVFDTRQNPQEIKRVK